MRKKEGTGDWGYRKKEGHEISAVWIMPDYNNFMFSRENTVYGNGILGLILNSQKLIE